MPRLGPMSAPSLAARSSPYFVRCPLATTFHPLRLFRSSSRTSSGAHVDRSSVGFYPEFLEQAHASVIDHERALRNGRESADVATCLATLSLPDTGQRIVRMVRTGERQQKTAEGAPPHSPSGWEAHRFCRSVVALSIVFRRGRHADLLHRDDYIATGHRRDSRPDASCVGAKLVANLD